jgi:predicted ATPase/class 3 adenylate cyclase
VAAQRAGEERTAPSGTLVFLFSDIEGSTQRWEAKREQMREAVERHEVLFRSAIEAHGGYVFKTVGDAFCCAFSSAAQALRAALAAQATLAAEDFTKVGGLKVRLALHAGVAQERDRDYFGPAVNRVARLVSIGHGGQVLLSNAAYELVKDDPPADAVFADLGSHRLRDLAQPERVWQAAIGSAAFDFPPLRSVASFPNNLPLQVTSFFGRENDMREIKQHIADHHLVTIFGAGGVGKTRLAIQCAAELLERFDDGVWIADLAPINEEQSVVNVVAEVLSVNQSQGGLDHAAIARWLGQKRLLLILDNCEHLIDSVARLVDNINRHCSEVRVIATSLQALGLSGEQLFRLPSLEVPPSQSAATPEDAIQFSAVALFVDRATLADRSFRLTEENVALVTRICRRLDGIPLAIELAAARLRTMSCATLERHLDERFKILTGGSRSALPRQQTLEALIDWSYELLGPPERDLFDRLAVFAGAFPLAAAEQVCSGDGIAERDILALLTSLTDKSLVVVETAADEERYSLLESTRDYACAKLQARGLSDRGKHRYAAYYLALAQQFDRTSHVTDLGYWLALVERERRHFRAVLEWALEQGHDVAQGAELVVALEMFWWHGGVEAEGRYWIGSALTRLDAIAHPEIAARLRQAQSRLTSRILFS